MKQLIFVIILFSITLQTMFAQENVQSVARLWNEVLLEGIRNDKARPTVHSRNLFHASIAMYDAWAIYDDEAKTFFLGDSLGGFGMEFIGIQKPNLPEEIKRAQEEAMSYALYKLLEDRFHNSPGFRKTLQGFEDLMDSLGYDIEFTGTDYATTNSPAALGNYIGEKIIEFGLQDGSNERKDFENRYYKPVNGPLVPTSPGNPTLLAPNRWQQLNIPGCEDQAGNPCDDIVPFLGPEWGVVTPFALKEEDRTIYMRDTNEYWTYHDPGIPPYIDTANGGAMSEEYKWGFSVVSLWSSHLDPSDGVMWDISPASLGNAQEMPNSIEGYRNYYNALEGGDPGTGYDVNPITGNPYPPQLVPRGDYTRVLAEFWADGPASETPPGHWFTILNYVNDHPLFEKKFKGVGDIIDDLEWDVKAYFVLAGTMHDAAVSAWGVKGWYDYLRPISAIRWMGDRGQSSSPQLPSYNNNGLPLREGYIELVQDEIRSPVKIIRT